MGKVIALRGKMQMNQCSPKKALWLSNGAKKSVRTHPVEMQAEQREAHQM